ncbi:MAG: DUF6675 family protein [Spirochaetaceae bacterium]
MRSFPYAIPALLLLFLCLPPASAGADVPEEWTGRSLRDVFPDLSPVQYAQLEDEGEITHFYRKEAELTLAPEAFGWREAQERIREFGPKIGVEALFLMPYPGALETAADPELEIYNTLRSVGTMEGIEYYSASRERMRIFYIDSYAVEDPDSRRPQRDPVVSSIPIEDSIYVYQRDSSFGRNVHRVTYGYTDGAYGVRMTNLTRMFYGILPLVAEENLDVYLTIIPVEEGIVFYGNSAVRVIGLFGMEHRARNSFYNRIKALFDWFSQEVTR